MASKIDDATYKQTYYFTDDFRSTAKDNPSIEGKPQINTTIKENPYRANVEIEGGEIVLQPDLSALFKANGKKHSQGGMDVLLRPESFIFSDFKDLAISEDEKDLFELKLGGSTAPQKNTPAKVVKQNVDVKHYNTLINNIQDPYKDELARKSSAMMLEKYIATLGNIAYLQENKKDFPDGLPPFSLGSAPVFDRETKDRVEESKQYGKYGGKINPYKEELPEAQMGWLYGMRYAQNKQKQETALPPSRKTSTAPQRIPLGDGITPPWLWTGDLYDKGLSQMQRDKAFNKLFNSYENIFSNPEVKDLAQDLPTFKAKLKGMGIDIDSYKDAKGFQQAIFDFDKKRDFKGLKNVFETYGTTLQGRDITKPVSEWTEADFKKNFIDNKGGVRTLLAALSVPDSTPTPGYNPPPKVPTPPPINQPSPEPGGVDGNAQGWKRANWEFTPWQKMSQLYNWGQYANVRRHMPYRSRYNATYADPSLLNPEQTVGDVKGQVTQQLNALGTLNPIMRNAQAAASYGAALNQIPSIRTQYDNQNAQIQNQFRQYNNQVRNNESLINMSNDQQYYQQAIEGRKNFDNLRQFTANNAMNNVLRDVETNQKLAYQLLTQNNPAYSFDWRTGDFLRNKMDIRDVTSDNTVDAYKDLFEAIDQVTDPYQKAQLLEKAYRQKNILPYLKNQPSSFKKGGKIKNPYR